MSKTATIGYYLTKGSVIFSKAFEVTEETEKEWEQLQKNAFHHGWHNFQVIDDNGDEIIINPHHVISIRKS